MVNIFVNEAGGLCGPGQLSLGLRLLGHFTGYCHFSGNNQDAN